MPITHRLSGAALALAVAVSAAPARAEERLAPEATFDLAPVAKFKTCFTRAGSIARATVQVFRGAQNDTLRLRLSGFKPGLAFDLFSVQNSPLNAAGAPLAGFRGFGLAWYQSDVQVDADGTADVTIKTILLDQAFGLIDRATAAVAPINTFHLGFWFNRPLDARPCGFTGVTPFNGDHKAGPLAFVTKPNATTGLGPLCRHPITTTTPATCDP